MSADGEPDPELQREQAYADWVQEQIDRMLKEAARMLDVADKATYRALSKRSENRRKELNANREGVLVGRLDMESEEVFYIGKLLVEAGDIEQPALINWRAPFAERFYQATPQDNQEVGRRRTIAMRKRKVTGYSDETLVPGFKVAEPELVVPEPPTIEQPSESAVSVSEPDATDSGLADLDGDRTLGDRSDEAQTPTRTATAATDAAVDRSEEEVDRELGETNQRDGATSQSGGVSTEHGENRLGSEPRGDSDEDSRIRAPDLLLEELERHRSGAMGEIVATIQADQDRLIRSDPDSPLVIQGGPGTGKTVVALHRAAWVLFHRRDDVDEPSVLVIGPNERFVEYISGVLPSLGEHNVTQLSVGGMCRSSLPRGERQRTQPRRTETDDVARIKGGVAMAEVVARAVWLAVVPAPLEVGYGRFILKVSEDDIRGILERFWQRAVPYQRVRAELREAVVSLMADQLAQRSQSTGSSASDMDSLETEIRRVMRDTKYLETCVPTVTARSALQRLFTDSAYRDQCADQLPDEQRSLLSSGTYANGTRYRWSEEDMPLLDEAATVLHGAPSTFTHVVADEAQDLSPMTWRAIKRRTRLGALTIAGDLAQATSAWSPETWDDVAENAELGADGLFAELKLGYRVPEQVMLFAGRLLPSAAPTTALPRSFRSTQPPEIMRAKHGLEQTVLSVVREHDETDGSIAVITPTSSTAGMQRACAEVDQSVAVLDAADAKGLEYDHVIVVEPADIAKSGSLGLRRLYIALTRCTQRLTVVHSKPLPAALALEISEDQVRSNVRQARLTKLRKTLGKRAATTAVHPRSYQRWTSEEEGDLVRRVETGLSIEEIADLHQRTPRSITRRLKRLGVDPPAED